MSTSRDPTTGRYVSKKKEVEETLQQISVEEDDTKQHELMGDIVNRFDSLEEHIERLQVEMSTMQETWEREGIAEASASNLSKRKTIKLEDEIKKLKDQMKIAPEGPGKKTDLPIKIAKTEPFDGKPENLSAFLSACELRFQTYPEEFQTLRARFLFILSYCSKGETIPWRESILADFPEYLNMIIEIANTRGTTNWEALKLYLIKQWKPVGYLLEAQYKMTHLRQGTESVKDYNTRFRLLSPQTQFDDQALLNFYRQGLKPIIRSKLMESGNIPTKLEDWQTQALDIDLGWRENQMLNQGNPRPRIRVAEHVLSQDYKRLSDEEYQKRLKERRCFKCGKLGHMAKQCFAKIRMQETNPEVLETTENNEDFQ